MPKDIGERPVPIPGGKPLYPNSFPVPGGTVHDTAIVDGSGNISNEHLTYNPTGGTKKERIHIWTPEKK